jgi:hypothetical protein
VEFWGVSFYDSIFVLYFFVDSSRPPLALKMVSYEFCFRTLRESLKPAVATLTDALTDAEAPAFVRRLELVKGFVLAANSAALRVLSNGEVDRAFDLFRSVADFLNPLVNSDVGGLAAAGRDDIPRAAAWTCGLTALAAMRLNNRNLSLLWAKRAAFYADATKCRALVAVVARLHMTCALSAASRHNDAWVVAQEALLFLDKAPRDLALVLAAPLRALDCAAPELNRNASVNTTLRFLRFVATYNAAVEHVHLRQFRNRPVSRAANPPPRR